MSDISKIKSEKFLTNLPKPPTFDGSDRTSSDIPFKEILKSAISYVNDYQLAAQDAQERLLTGKTDNIVEVLMAVKRAEKIFNLLVQIRNKLMDAFEEIMRMRV